ncbi:MAG: hypothetical protein Q4D04_13465 [Clostridia bacterium]|nr:hypothetical protein [Clostridia bacterium]
MAGGIEDVASRLEAYIHPRIPETERQRSAFDAAVLAQLNYEGQRGGACPGMTSASVDGLSVTLGRPFSAHLDDENISPLAKAELLRAGLLPGYMPVAKRR